MKIYIDTENKDSLIIEKGHKKDLKKELEEVAYGFSLITARIILKDHADTIRAGLLEDTISWAADLYVFLCVAAVSRQPGDEKIRRKV